MVMDPLGSVCQSAPDLANRPGDSPFFHGHDSKGIGLLHPAAKGRAARQLAWLCFASRALDRPVRVYKKKRAADWQPAGCCCSSRSGRFVLAADAGFTPGGYVLGATALQDFLGQVALLGILGMHRDQHVAL